MEQFGVHAKNMQVGVKLVGDLKQISLIIPFYKYFVRKWR